jgi:nucleoid-associated protein YgaU
MGLFNFWRGGKKLETSEEGKAPSPEDLNKEVKALGLVGEDLDIRVDGDKVTVAGDVDQETKEKVIVAVGNVEGVAQVDDQMSGVEPKLHTVEKGDTLWAIAEKTLGDGSRYNEIFEANKPMLSDPDKIYPGQVLRIPS